MANQYAVDAGGTLSVAATWESAPLAGDATGPPIAGDDIIIDISGTVTADEAVVGGSFLLTTGTYVDGGQTHAISGSILLNGGTFTSTGVWTMTASGNWSAATTAFKIGEKTDDPLKMYLSDIYTIAANLAGIPGISIPCGFDENNLPIGLQILAPAFGEDKLLRIARMFEKQTDWHTKKAPLIS